MEERQRRLESTNHSLMLRIQVSRGFRGVVVVWFTVLVHHMDVAAASQTLISLFCRSWSFRLASMASPLPPPTHLPRSPPPPLWTPRPCSLLHCFTPFPLPPPPPPPPWWLPLWVWMLWLLRTWMSLREPPLFSPQTWCLTWGWLTWTAWGASWWRTGAGQEWCPTLCCPAELRRPAAEGAASAWMRIFDDPIAHRDLIGQNWRRDFIFNFFLGNCFSICDINKAKNTPRWCSVTETISMSSRGLPFVLKCCCHSCCCKPQCQNCVQVPHTHSPELLRLKVT